MASDEDFLSFVSVRPINLGDKTTFLDFAGEMLNSLCFSEESFPSERTCKTEVVRYKKGNKEKGKQEAKTIPIDQHFTHNELS